MLRAINGDADVIRCSYGKAKFSLVMCHVLLAARVVAGEPHRIAPRDSRRDQVSRVRARTLKGGEKGKYKVP